MWIKSFVDCLDNATQSNPRIEDAIALKELQLPKRIYKYRGDSTYSRTNLNTDTVWMASPDAYNDPYDCSFSVAEEQVVTALKKSLIPEFAKVYKLVPMQVKDLLDRAASIGADPLTSLADAAAKINGSSPGQNPQQMAEFVSLIAPKMIANTIDFLRQWRKVTKICSFSAVNDSILMWGHYAQDHKGFCVEYDLEGLEGKHLLRKNLYPVIYTPSLYDLTSFIEKLVGPEREDFNSLAPLLAVLHKFVGWNYEEEWRSVQFTSGIVADHNVAVPTPSRVFLGAKMTRDKAKEIAAICDAKSIKVLQMRMANNRFELLPEAYIP